MDERQRLSYQAFLAAVVESSDDAIIAKTTDGVITSCNPAVERIFGYSADELIGESVHVLIPPERQQEEEEILRRIRRGDRVDHYETVRIRKDGKPIDVSLTISPVTDASGVVIGASKIVRDVTDQKRRRAMEAHLAAIVASSTDAILSMDLNGVIQTCNESAVLMYGYCEAELVGKSIGVLIPTERQHEVHEILATISGGERIEHFETVRVAKDGRRVDVSLSVSPILDGSGAVVGLAKVARDVGEQKRLARELAAQREWFRVTLASIGDAVIACDAEGRVTFMNAAAEELTGWTTGDAVGRDLAEVFRIVNESTRLTVESPVTRVLAEGIVVGLANHTILIAADGTERPIDDSGAPIRSRDGRIIGVVLVFRDISERRRAEAERHVVAAERERLLEAERAARAEAERASRMKDEFVAMVSHELRTPLNAILGWTRLMTDASDDTEIVRRGLDVISRNTDTQAQLISDLLDMSRIVSGTLRLSFERVDLKSLVEGAIETVQHSAEQKRITILPNLEAGAPVAGDRSRLQQIVWNLLWNAITFTPEGGHIRVRLRHSDSGAELMVSDTGVGIQPEFLPHVFERFRQENVSITRQFGGLGLGLSIVKHLVDLHAGSIEAESAGHGRGATFTVRLPAGSARATSSGSTDGSSARAEVTPPVGLLEGVRILVVEDEKDTRDLLCRFLTSYGAAVVLAASAAEALELLPDASANFLISDIGLPDMDGYELLRRIRLEDPLPTAEIPAIALTAYARPEDRMLAFRAGYQAHLAKPVEPADLVAAIADLANGRTH